MGGQVLQSILFVIFINDLTRVSKVKLTADDAMIYGVATHRGHQTLLDHLNCLEEDCQPCKLDI